MKRLTANQLLEKIKTVPGWKLVEYPDQEIRLFVKYKINGPVQEFFGPNPVETDADMYQAFLYRVEAEAKPSNDLVYVNVPRIDADEFFAKIEEAVLWSFSVRENTDSVELLVMLPEGKFQRYLSRNISTMSDSEFSSFRAKLAECESKENRWKD